ncbi:DNA binding domain-containing protein, excisionase family [Mycobacterium sp. 283mftsu]|nr:DNA binding domain-containing protein, excisionase family [Mycobacterium sp. 283mftsu]
MPEKLMSLTEAAEYRGVSPNSVRNYIAKQRLKYQGVGQKLIKFRKHDLDEFIDR